MFAFYVTSDPEYIAFNKARVLSKMNSVAFVNFPSKILSLKFANKDVVSF